MTPRRATLPLYWLIPALALAILALGLAFSIMADHRNDGDTQRRLQALTLARQAALRYRLALNGTHYRLAALARTHSLAQTDAEACKATVAAALEEQSGFAGITMLAPSGEAICGLPQTPRNVADQDWFRRVLAERGPVQGGVQWDGPTGPVVSVAAYPSLTPSGLVAAVLAASVDLSWLSEQVGAGTPADAVITVLDKTGIIMARYPAAQSWLGKSLAALPVTARMLDGGEGNAEGRDDTGSRRVFGFVPRPGGGAVVAALPPAAGSALDTPALPVAVGSVLLLLITAYLLRRHFLAPAAIGQADMDMLKYSNRMLTAEIAVRRQAEQALRDSENRFRLALTIAPIVVFAQDEDLNYTWLCSQTLGYQPPQFIGKGERALFEPETAQLLEGLKCRVMATGTGLRTEVHVRFKPPYEPRVFDLKLKPARDADNRICGVLGVAVDITASHLAKEEMQEARRQAEQANAAKSRFLAAANHDLRQPFQALELFHDILTARVSDPECRSVLDKMGQAMAAGEALLNAMLDMSALDAGLTRADIGDVPASALLERLCSHYQAAAATKGLSLRCLPSSLVLRSDAALLERLLDKIVANAVRHTQKGGILIACRRRDGMARFEVWDSGPGIPRSQLSAIFEDFYQLGNPERDRAKGLGLGLSIVRRISKLLNHPVAVRSRVDKGTVFIVTVPLADAAPQASAAPAPAIAAAEEPVDATYEPDPSAVEVSAPA